ncbi:hypothetical protein ASL20_22805 [Cupriavidus necator]|uniref:HNH endonuclease n=1 Tax=Cupriavidus necator TaxID=106590 RepID=UPI0007356E23|nr:HNH endonuclease [Cupriavidus necator]KUE86588.1 hypothetical protein ASL20_22805 [Cupriavidus necator]
MNERIFKTTDDEYLGWMSQHPEGYVLNTTRYESSYAVLHASGCHHISTYTRKYAKDAFTGENYIKVCSDRAIDVYRWSKSNRSSAPLKVCMTCQPDFSPSEALDNEQIVSDLEEIAQRPGLKPTQREALVQARLGQGAYRKQMLELWEGKCAVTGFTIQSALIASHAKPWADSNDEERLDPCNGLPLIATLDRLFDKFLIAFDPETGEMLVSREIGEADRTILGLPANLRKVPNEQQARYLRLHLDNFAMNNPS